jgi:hypothetical protein
MKQLLHLFTILFALGGHAQITIEGTLIDTHTVIHGLDIPWEVQWGADDHIWVTERYGMVSRVHPETGAKDTILDLRGQVTQ